MLFEFCDHLFLGFCWSHGSCNNWSVFGIAKHFFQFHIYMSTWAGTGEKKNEKLVDWKKSLVDY